MKENAHISVMLEEVINRLSPQNDKVYIDCTFGAGGYSRAILESCNCHVIAIDRDPSVKIYADKLKEEFQDRFTFIEGKFSDIEKICQKHKIKPDGIVMDIGVSSMQIDTPERGFSFMHNGDLDMGMGNNDRSAKDLINSYPEEDIANIIYKYGEERKSRRIARAIVNARQEEDITTTKQLSDIICSVNKRAKDGIHPATRSFQAIRIWVNDELGELETALNSSENILNNNGRLVVVTFHSLEDKIVKNYLRHASGRVERGSRYLPDIGGNDVKESFKIITRKPDLPTEKEIRNNIRSRSAKLRAAIRIREEISDKKDNNYV